MESYYGYVLWQGDVTEFQCSFVVHELTHDRDKDKFIRVYVDITQDKAYAGVNYISSLDLLYTTEQFEGLMKEDKLLDNLKHHYLDRQILTKDFDEYYH